LTNDSKKLYKIKKKYFPKKIKPDYLNKRLKNDFFRQKQKEKHRFLQKKYFLINLEQPSENPVFNFREKKFEQF
jgi:hypothetical protein